MKHRFFKSFSPIRIGLVLFVLATAGFQGCEEGGACRDATSSLQECIDCLNRSCNGCAASGGYHFVQGSKCECK
jgi:hypothetical protein